MQQYVPGRHSCLNDMDEFIQGTVLKDYPDMNQSNEESHLTPMLVSGEVSRKRPSSDKVIRFVFFKLM